MIKSNDTLTFNYVGKETYFYTCMWYSNKYTYL